MGWNTNVRFDADPVKRKFRPIHNNTGPIDREMKARAGRIFDAKGFLFKIKRQTKPVRGTAVPAYRLKTASAEHTDAKTSVKLLGLLIYKAKDTKPVKVIKKKSGSDIAAKWVFSMIGDIIKMREPKIPITHRRVAA
jgi:hypothetical protein